MPSIHDKPPDSTAVVTLASAFAMDASQFNNQKTVGSTDQKMANCAGKLELRNVLNLHALTDHTVKLNVTCNIQVLVS